MKYRQLNLFSVDPIFAELFLSIVGVSFYYYRQISIQVALDDIVAPGYSYFFFGAQYLIVYFHTC
jgi:hypothetical protein